MHAEIIRGWCILMSATYFKMHQKIRWIDGWTEGWKDVDIDKINRIKCKLKNLVGRYMSIHVIISTVCMFGDVPNIMLRQNY